VGGVVVVVDDVLSIPILVGKSCPSLLPSRQITTLTGDRDLWERNTDIV